MARNIKKNILILKNEDKRNSNFSGKNLQKADFFKTRFENSNFSKANMRACKAKFCCFIGCDLTGVNFTGADLRGSNFTGANLTGATLNAAKLQGANFKDAIVNGIDFTHAKTATAKNLVTPLPKEIPDHVKSDTWKAKCAYLIIKQAHYTLEAATKYAQVAYDSFDGNIEGVSPQKYIEQNNIDSSLAG